MLVVTKLDRLRKDTSGRSDFINNAAKLTDKLMLNTLLIGFDEIVITQTVNSWKFVNFSYLIRLRGTSIGT